jgi:hypothetical protein
MLRLVEAVVGIVLIYLGLQWFGRERRATAVLYGLAAIAGLVLVVHGILLYLVPDFFKPSI